jgi:Family of unknown function (DUF5677)
MASKSEWLVLADRLYAKGVDVFNHSTVLENEAGTRDPKVVGLTLLARTLGTIRAAVQLLENAHVVEARTLTRCCWENLFWIAALTKQGDEFVEAMELDDAANRMKRANALLKWTESQKDEQFDFVQKLEVFHTDMKAKHGKPDTIKHEKAAIDGGVHGGYQVYRELSGDAAHPSALSLSRHITWSEGENPVFTLHAQPQLDAREVEDTLELLCSAVLGVIIAANQITEGTDVGERVNGLAADFKAMSDANKVARNET